MSALTAESRGIASFVIGVEMDMEIACKIRDKITDGKRTAMIAKQAAYTLGLDNIGRRFDDVWDILESVDRDFQQLIVKCHQQ